MAVNTINTVLKSGTEAEALTKLVAISSYPAMGGAPEQIDVTDLDMDVEAFINGVQKLDPLEFDYFYPGKTAYQAIKAREATDKFFAIEFGENGIDGVLAWEGDFVTWIEGGGVNEARTCKLQIAAQTAPTLKE